MSLRKVERQQIKAGCGGARYCQDFVNEFALRWTADYYSEGQELVASWGGKGASMLGLAGTVDKFSFERLCDNRNPMTGEPLTVRTRCERTVGYDFTFSVPKSVSLLYAISGDQDILEAFRAAVVPERKLVTEASKRGLGVVTVEGVTNEVRERPLIRSDITGRRMAPVA